MDNKIVYQFIFEKSADFDPEKEIINKIKEDLDYAGVNVDKDLISDCLLVLFVKDIGGDKSILYFSLEFAEEMLPKGEIANQVLGQFNDWLKNHEKIKLVFRYRDDYLFNDLDKYYKEIFDIEMELREVISLIFIDTYGDDFYNLLRDFNITLRYEPKNKKEKHNELEKRFEDNLENEFFYLLFPDYQSFSKIKPTKIEDIVSILTGSQNFKESQDKMNNRGIKKEEYVDFLNSIKEDLDSIENIRNCVAHNRTPLEKEMESYENAKLKIKQKIKDFCNNFKII